MAVISDLVGSSSLTKFVREPLSFQMCIQTLFNQTSPQIIALLLMKVIHVPAMEIINNTAPITTKITVRTTNYDVRK